MEDDVIVINPKTARASCKIYKCAKCSYQTNRVYNVQRHLVKHYEKPPKELQHICPYAGCSFSTLRWDNLNRHKKRVHPVKNIIDRDSTTMNSGEVSEPMPCEEEVMLSDEDIASEHSAEYLLDDELASMGDEEQASLPYDESSQSVNDFPASIPDIQTPKSALDSKIIKQKNIRPKRKYLNGKTKAYECNTCKYRTTRFYNIKRHIVKHKENPSDGVLLHVCIISGCNFVTPRWDNLCRHVKRIHPESAAPSPNA